MSRFSEPPAKPNGADPREVGGYPSYLDDLAVAPLLTEFLGRAVYSNGAERETGSVLIFVNDGQLKVMFKSPEEDRVGFAVLKSLDTLLSDLNALLEGGRVDWRRDKNRRRTYR